MVAVAARLKQKHLSLMPGNAGSGTFFHSVLATEPISAMASISENDANAVTMTSAAARNLRCCATR